MIRFRCPQCEKSVKVPEDRAGGVVRCPRCNARCEAPAHASAATAARTSSGGAPPGAEGRGRHGRAVGDEAPGLFSGMGRRERRALAGAATVGIVSLLLPFVAPLFPGGEAVGARATAWAVFLVPCSLMLSLAILYGHATGCPSCGRWCGRRSVESEFVDRVGFEKGGVPYARATYRTTFECAFCSH